MGLLLYVLARARAQRLHVFSPKHRRANEGWTAVEVLRLAGVLTDREAWGGCAAAAADEEAADVEGGGVSRCTMLTYSPDTLVVALAHAGWLAGDAAPAAPDVVLRLDAKGQLRPL